MLISVDDIINSKSYIEIFPDIINFKKDYRELIPTIHPDKCKNPNAQEATKILNKYKDQIENGIKYLDDSGEIIYFPLHCIMSGDAVLLNNSLEFFRLINLAKKKTWNLFPSYLPSSIIKEGKTLRASFDERSLPLLGLQLEENHIVWILSRLLEFITYLHSMRISHNGLNPGSVYVTPKMHCIKVISFYHSTRLDYKSMKNKNIATKFPSFYTKISTDTMEALDIECAKKIAIYLLGDKHGFGTRFKKLKKGLSSFLQTYHTNAFTAFDEYRKMVNKNYKKQFISLNI